MITFPHSGARHVLDRIFRSGGATRFGLVRTLEGGLTKATVLSDIVECSFPGYLSRKLLPESWNPATTVDEQTYIEYTTQLVFTRSDDGTAQLCRGYFVTDEDTGALIYAELFADAIAFAVKNSSVRVTPRILMT